MREPKARAKRPRAVGRCWICGGPIWTYAERVRTSFYGRNQYRHVDCHPPGPQLGRIPDSR
jgi:hypothetical protein